MEPQNLRFAGGSAETVLHPLVAIALLLAVILILVLPRKHVVVPLLLTILFVPKGQNIVLGGAHLTAAKIVFVAGLVRWVMLRHSLTLPSGFNPIDRVFALWAVCYPTVFTLQYLQSQALFKSAGDLIDTLGGYFVLRFFINDEEDMRRVIRLLAVISAIMAACMLVELCTEVNVFGLLGGTRATSEVRSGLVRANGAFQHSLLAGCFGATLFPVFLSLWKDKRYRTAVLVGAISSTAIVLSAHGSTATMAFGAGVLALCFWPFRRLMALVRWGIVAALVGLHLVMNGPVWSLIEKIDLTGSSSSYHRYMLVDNCIRHFADWWLLGARNYDTWGWDMWDLSNQYVAYAFTGGLATLVLFVAIITLSFKGLGVARKRLANDRKQEWFVWCLGVALFTHVVAYFGIGYFDQTQFAWFVLLAIISVVVTKPNSVQVPRAQESRALRYKLSRATQSPALETSLEPR